MFVGADLIAGATVQIGLRAREERREFLDRLRTFRGLPIPAQLEWTFREESPRALVRQDQKLAHSCHVDASATNLKPKPNLNSAIWKSKERCGPTCARLASL